MITIPYYSFSLGIISGQGILRNTKNLVKKLNEATELHNINIPSVGYVAFIELKKKANIPELFSLLRHNHPFVKLCKPGAGR